MKVQNHNSTEGASIRKLRLQAGLTQEALAHLAKVTTQTIWRLENQTDFNPRIQTLRAIARALGVTFDKLARK